MNMNKKRLAGFLFGLVLALGLIVGTSVTARTAYAESGEIVVNIGTGTGETSNGPPKMRRYGACRYFGCPAFVATEGPHRGREGRFWIVQAFGT